MHFAGLLVHHKRTLQQVETVVVDTIGEAFFQQIEIEVLTFAQGHSCVTTGRIVTRSIMGAIGAAGNASAGATPPGQAGSRLGRSPRQLVFAVTPAVSQRETTSSAAGRRRCRRRCSLETVPSRSSRPVASSVRTYPLEIVSRANAD